jgi:hypothetical protein
MGKMGRICLAMLALAVVAWAGDPWKEKPYQQWDQKEVLKVLNDSPWAKVEVVEATWRGASPAAYPGGSHEGAPAQAQPSESSSGGYAGGMGGMAAAAPTGASGGTSGEAGGTVGGTAGGASQQGPAEVGFHVRWLSSRTIREGLVRLAILDGRLKEADGEKFLAQEPAEYRLQVFGPDMTPFAKVEEADLKQDSSLTMKKSKQKLAPARVEIERSKDGKSVAGITFVFPKKLENGEAAIGPEEKGVEFVCRAGKVTLRYGFDPQKMVDKQGRDL